MILSKLDSDYKAQCEFCGQKFKLKGKCYQNHVSKCKKYAAKVLLKSNSCVYCCRNFVIKGACYKKHIEKCK